MADPHVLQTELRRGSSAMDSVYVMDELTTRYKNLRRPQNMVQLDIRKAFDTVDRHRLWSKLRRRTVPEHVIKLLMSLFEGCTAQMFINGVRGDVVELMIDLSRERLSVQCQQVQSPRPRCYT